jgi:hypothetical protein
MAIVRGTGYVSGQGRELLTTDDAHPPAVKQGTGRLIVAAGVDAGGTYHTLLTDANGQLQLANFTALTLSNRTEEIDPISQHYVSETLAEVTDQADATYDYYIDMAGFGKSGLQLDLSCGLGTVTATFWITLRDDGTAPAACNYQNVTNDLFGVPSLVAAAGAAADMWIDDTGATGAAKYIRVRIVAATGGAGAQLGDWTLLHKRWYA